MKRPLLLTVLLGAMCAGCVLHPDRADDDAVRYAQAWETPRLEQQTVALVFTTEGDYTESDLLARTINVLVGSGRFRIARPGETPTVRVELTMALRRKTHVLRTVCGALLGYVWPIDARDYVCEVFVVIRKPSGELIRRHYVQGRGRERLWLGYLVWPRWIWNADRAKVIYRDAVKAAAVKIARTLMPKAKP